MADAWRDAPAPRPRRLVMTALVALLVALALGAAVWVRFMTGISAAPVPASLTDAVPVLTPPVGDASAAAPAAGSGGSAAAAPAAAGAAPASVPSAPATAHRVTIPAPPELVSPTSTEPPVDGAWLDRTAVSTGIPRRALQAYAAADLELLREQPACGLGWNTLAGIGEVESGHGRQLNAAGYSTAPILGPSVEGGQHAEGPMQFMPGTWAKWGADGNGDGVKDPNQIDDATLAAARYLCSYGSLDTAAGWRAAVFGYNHLDSYVNAVAAQASVYAQRAGS